MLHRFAVFCRADFCSASWKSSICPRQLDMHDADGEKKRKKNGQIKRKPLERYVTDLMV
jgi:hypothetical protein